MSTPPDLFDDLFDDLESISDYTDNGVPPPPPVDDMADLLGSVADNDKSKIGMGIITIFPPSSHPSWLDPATYFEDPNATLDKWCGKFEIAPATGELHAHLFFKFIKTQRWKFDRLRKRISERIGKGCNIKRSRSWSAENVQHCVNYVLKTESTAPDTVPFIWNNCCAFDQKTWDKRTKPKVDKSSERCDYIMSKPQHWSWAKIVHETDESRALLCDCSWGKKFHEMRAASDPRRTIENVIIMYGAGGTGKTTLAEAWDFKADEPVETRYYKRNSDDNAFWGGGSTAYRGQRIIHFEEYGGRETLSNIKTWCDLGKYGPSVNIKNGGAELNHDTVIFTSNDHPAGWYRHKWAKDPKQFHPFWRRATKVWFFPATRPDGSPNRPDESNPPYYIDQTDEWVGFQGDYDAAVAHADANWPIAEDIEDAGGAMAPGFELPTTRKREAPIEPFHEYCRTGKFPKHN